MDPVKVNVEFTEYEYFAHGYQGKLKYWQYALAQLVKQKDEDVFLLQIKTFNNGIVSYYKWVYILFVIL